MAGTRFQCTRQDCTGQMNACEDVQFLKCAVCGGIDESERLLEEEEQALEELQRAMMYTPTRRSQLEPALDAIEAACARLAALLHK